MTSHVAVPFFCATEAGWAVLLSLADDADELPSYAAAAAEIDELLQEQPLELLILDVTAVHAMAEWCRANGHRLDHAGRAAWLLHMSLALNITMGSA
jgi:hypothetical protein